MKKNRITIPGFYDDILEMTEKERKEMARAPFNLDQYRQTIGVDQVGGEEGDCRARLIIFPPEQYNR